MSSFEDLGVAPDILRAIQEMGFATPMPVQEAVIPHLLTESTDLIALAQTGTGKTAAYGLPLIQLTDLGRREPQSLILCPTRELCLQIAGDLSDYAKYTAGLHVLPVYGGSSIESQIRALRQGVHIIVATPGRLIDLMERGTVSLRTVSCVVLDEADKMLDMGFTDSINAILADVPTERKTLLFSATMSQEIARIAANYLHEPREITIGRKNEGTANVRHVAYCVHAKDKYAALKRVVDYYPDIYAIIFCRTRKETQEVADKLMEEGYNADTLHGDLSQAQRDTVMQKFRLRHLQLLVATDVAARGLDVDDLTHVINYGLPDDLEVYTHRSGRTGRAGKTGTSIAIINLRERGKIRQIERTLGKTFEEGVMPTGQQICGQQLYKMIDDLEKVQVNEEEIAAFMPDIYRKLDWLSKEDVVKRMVSHVFNRFLDYYRDREEIQTVTSESQRRDRKDRDAKGRDRHAGEGTGRDRAAGPRRQAEEGYTRILINLGKRDNFFVPELMSLVNRQLPQERIPLGRIDLMPRFSFFEVPEACARQVVDALSGAGWNGRKVSVQITHDQQDGTDMADGFASDRPGRATKRKAATDRPAFRGGVRAGRATRADRSDDRYTDRRGDHRPAGDHRNEGWTEARTPGLRAPRAKAGKDAKTVGKSDKATRPAPQKPSREERGYTKPRGKKDDWKQFFLHTDDRPLRGEEPDFTEEGWAKPKK